MTIKSKRPLALLAAGLWIASLAAACNPPTPLPQTPPPAAPGTELPAPAISTSAAPSPTAAVLPTAADTAMPLPDAAFTDFPGAQAAAATVAADGKIFVVLGQANRIMVSRSTDGGFTFTEPVRANAGVPAFAMRIERPSIIANADGSVGVVWLQLIDSTHATVWYATSQDGGQSFGPAVQVSESGPYRTMLPRLAEDATQNPVIAWQEDGHLHVARSFDGGAKFATDLVVDDRTCDCCQPQPVATGNQVFVAYRNLEEDAAGQAIRDIYVAASADDGLTFAAPVRVSDAPWYLNACPSSGPALAYGGQRLYVAWMDGRNDAEQDLSRTDIWLAGSADGGQTFSNNLRVNPVEGYRNNLPALAVAQDGHLHILWQTDEISRTVLYYAASNDGGQTFSAPWIVARSDDGTQRGTPEHATLAVGGDNRVYASWVDDLGAHLATW
jgi:BNR repeat-like domain